MKRRQLFKSLAALALGTWIPDWVPTEIATSDTFPAEPTPNIRHITRSTDHPELLDVPLRKIFFEHLTVTPPEYTRWISVYGSRGF